MNKPPGILKLLFPSITWHKNRHEKNIYITFDDGPTPASTQWIIDILKKYDAKASFFCLGENAEKHPELIALIKDSGHAIGNHGYAHINGWKTSTQSYLENLEKGNILLQTNLFRPPYGKLKLKQYFKIKAKHQIVMWDYISTDYIQKADLDQAGEKMIKNIQNGSVVVFHDSEKAFSNMKYLLIKTLSHFSSKSYHFLPL